MRDSRTDELWQLNFGEPSRRTKELIENLHGSLAKLESAMNKKADEILSKDNA